MKSIVSGVSNYAIYLSSQSKKMGEAHHQTTPVRQLSNSLSMETLQIEHKCFKPSVNDLHLKVALNVCFSMIFFT